MSNFQSHIESILFITNHSLSLKKLATMVGADKKQVEEAVGALEAKYNQPDSGVKLQRIDDDVQLVTSGDSAKVVSEFIKEETSGELTKPSLETLTIIAYRGPIGRAELEQIRGVNCSVILRNLLIRGLVEAHEDKKNMVTTYQITFDLLRYLGLSKQSELPNYEQLHSHESLQQHLDRQNAQAAPIVNDAPAA